MAGWSAFPSWTCSPIAISLPTARSQLIKFIRDLLFWLFEETGQNMLELGLLLKIESKICDGGGFAQTSLPNNTAVSDRQPVRQMNVCKVQVSIPNPIDVAFFQIFFYTGFSKNRCIADGMESKIAQV